MAKYKRHEVINAVYQTRLVPLFFNSDVELVKRAVKACYDGGARVFEFTNRGDFAHEIFAEVNKYALKELPGMIMGVGSIVEPGTASLYMQLGANFIVTPLLNIEVVKTCNRRKVACLPGCATLSEINQAEEYGCEIVKIFPGGTIGGPAFVKNISAPCSWTSIMPSGGVNTSEEGLKAWFDSGVSCVGMGSNLFLKDSEGNFDFAKTTSDVSSVLSIIKKLKG